MEAMTKLGGNRTGGTRHLCGKRAHARHTDDTHAFSQSTSADYASNWGPASFRVI